MKYLSLDGLSHFWQSVKNTFYSATNQPPYPVTSVNGQTGDVTVAAGGAVTSVNNKTGAVTLTKSDVELGNVDNTADSSKSVYDSARLGGSLPSAFAPAIASPVSGWSYGTNVSAYTTDVVTTFSKMGNFVYISALLNFASSRPAYSSLFILPSTLRPATLRVGSIQSYKGTDSYSCIVAGAYIYSDATIPAGQWALSFGYFI